MSGAARDATIYLDHEGDALNVALLSPAVEGTAMTAAADVRCLVEVATGLSIRPRVRRWAHLPECVLDTSFSIDARYTSAITVCDRYLKH